MLSCQNGKAPSWRTVKHEVQVLHLLQLTTKIAAIYDCCAPLAKHSRSMEANSLVAWKNDLQPFCGEKGHKSLPLAQHCGNRFNIIFYNAAGVYTLLPFLMKEFLSFNCSNRLLQAVKADLAVPAFLTGCHALGIVGKFISAPLWRYLVQDDFPLHKIIPVNEELHKSLGQYERDASPLLDGVATAFTSAKVSQTSSVLDNLLKPTENDARAKELLQLLCTCLHT